MKLSGFIHLSDKRTEAKTEVGFRPFVGLGAVGYLPFDDKMSQSSLRFVVVRRNNVRKTETCQVFLFVFEK